MLKFTSKAKFPVEGEAAILSLWAKHAWPYSDLTKVFNGESTPDCSGCSAEGAIINVCICGTPSWEPLWTQVSAKQV